MARVLGVCGIVNSCACEEHAYVCACARAWVRVYVCMCKSAYTYLRKEKQARFKSMFLRSLELYFPVYRG